MLPSLDVVLVPLLHRAELLIPLLVIAFVTSDLLARYSGAAKLITKTQQVATRFQRKLDRPERGIATRVYRGIAALCLLLFPALLLGLLLSHPHPLAQLLRVVLITGLFGHAFGTWRLWRAWRTARAHRLPLELPKQSHLFADSHAVLRYLIATSGEQFATGIVGAAVWYILGGVPLLLAYRLLALLATTWHSPLFGWAAHALFRLLDAVPKLLTWLLLILASFFLPKTHPLAARHARSLAGLQSYLLGISLGGAMPQGTLPWTGTGTPKLQPAHLLRWLLLMVVATVFFLLLLAAPTLYKILIIII